MRTDVVKRFGERLSRAAGRACEPQNSMTASGCCTPRQMGPALNCARLISGERHYR